MSDNKNNYKAEITSCTTELSKKEQVYLTFMTGFDKLDELIQGFEDKLYMENPECAVVEVHNEAAENKDYKVYIFFNKEAGLFYQTSSDSCYEAYMQIKNIMEDEPFNVNFMKLPSKNYNGKAFLTASIALGSD